MSALRTYVKQTPEQDAATRKAQLEMCLPEWEDDETRAGNRYREHAENER